MKQLEIGSEELNSLIGEYIQSGNLNFLLGSGASLPAISLAGNIENDIDQLIAAEKWDDANITALQFIQYIEERNTYLRPGSEDDETRATLKAYTDFLTTLDEILFERKNFLLPRQANVFSTNYDLFIEEAAVNLASLIINDGFDRTSSTGSSFIFSPEQFLDRTYRSGAVYSRQIEIPTINLFKLHGSLSWQRVNEQIVYREESPDPISQDEIKDSAKVKSELLKRAVVLPNVQKFNSTVMDRIYYDLLRFFANLLEKENAVLIIFGFSFADKHIYDMTKRALRNPTAQLILFPYDQLASESFSQLFGDQRNALIVNPKDDETTNFEAFTACLRSALPIKVNTE